MRVKLREADSAGPLTLTVCVNVRSEQIVPCCGKRGGIELAAAVTGKVQARRLPVSVQTIKCLGLCAKGPNARLAPSNSWFNEIGPADVDALLDVLAEVSARHVAEHAEPVPKSPPIKETPP